MTFVVAGVHISPGDHPTPRDQAPHHLLQVVAKVGGNDMSHLARARPGGALQDLAAQAGDFVDQVILDISLAVVVASKDKYFLLVGVVEENVTVFLRNGTHGIST